MPGPTDRGAFRLLLLVALEGGCAARAGDPAERIPSTEGARMRAASTDRGFLKGQLHVHSNESGDADNAPEDVARWYASRGYDFIVFSDHNDITQPADVDGLLVLPGIELSTFLETCDPPPLPGMLCMVHVNALLVGTADRGHHRWSPGHDLRRLSLYASATDEAFALGGLPMLNHPNFHFTADEDIAATLAAEGVRLIEVANQKTRASNGGDDDHPSVEAVWDAVLGTGLDMWGVATDDAHHVGEDSRSVGDRGWVQVRASRDEASIRDALARGDFYSSTGVELSRVEVRDGWLHLEVAPTTWRSRFDFIGAGGVVLETTTGFAADFPLADADGYVRAVVTAPNGCQAWTQPIR